MTELAFLSVDIENDGENIEDEFEGCISTISTDKCVYLTDKQAESEVACSNANERHETVEICQKTVNPNNRVNSENFNILRVIGKGAYGKVFLVQKIGGIDQGRLYAMKVLKKARLVCSEKDKAHTASERNILEMLRHPFLVKLHYAFQNHSNLYIVLEYCCGGELFNHLEREGSLLENAACFYTAEIALAIGHLHSLGIIYRDLKSENVLLDRQGHIKLTDFGLSKEGVCTTNTFCGTIEYMAPEIIRCEGHGKPVDWWSLGTLLFDMLSGGPPFSQEKSSEATTRKILTAPLRIPASFSPEVSNLIRGLLKRDPRERLGTRGDVEEIKQHKFFRRYEINWSDVLHRRLRPPFKPKLSSDSDVSMFDPYFTHLQPVVSPADSARLIPPDMFQGFSYVAPSVCENTDGDSWVEPPASGTQWRRQFGARGAMSAGRLQRIGVASTCGTKGNIRHTNRPPPSDKIQSTQPMELITGAAITQSDLHLRSALVSNVIMPTIATADTCSTVLHSGEGKWGTGCLLPPSTATHTTIQPPFKGVSGTGFSHTTGDPTKSFVEDDDDGDGAVNDEEDEIEDEDVPGAKQICPSHFKPFTYASQPLANSTLNNPVVAASSKPTSQLLHPRVLPHSLSGVSLRGTATHFIGSQFNVAPIGVTESGQRTLPSTVRPVTSNVLPSVPRRSLGLASPTPPYNSPPVTSASSTPSNTKCSTM